MERLQQQPLQPSDAPPAHFPFRVAAHGPVEASSPSAETRRPAATGECTPLPAAYYAAAPPASPLSGAVASEATSTAAASPSSNSSSRNIAQQHRSSSRKTAADAFKEAAAAATTSPVRLSSPPPSPPETAAADLPPFSGAEVHQSVEAAASQDRAAHAAAVTSVAGGPGKTSSSAGPEQQQKLGSSSCVAASPGTASWWERSAAAAAAIPPAGVAEYRKSVGTTAATAAAADAAGDTPAPPAAATARRRPWTSATAAGGGAGAAAAGGRAATMTRAPDGSGGPFFRRRRPAPVELANGSSTATAPASGDAEASAAARSSRVFGTQRLRDVLLKKPSMLFAPLTSSLRRPRVSATVQSVLSSSSLYQTAPGASVPGRSSTLNETSNTATAVMKEAVAPRALLEEQLLHEAQPQPQAPHVYDEQEYLAQPPHDMVPQKEQGEADEEEEEEWEQQRRLQQQKPQNRRSGSQQMPQSQRRSSRRRCESMETGGESEAGEQLSRYHCSESVGSSDRSSSSPLPAAAVRPPRAAACTRQAIRHPSSRRGGGWAAQQQQQHFPSAHGSSAADSLSSFSRSFSGSSAPLHPQQHHHHHTHDQQHSLAGGGSGMGSPQQQQGKETFWVRALWTIILVSTFFVILAAGHVYCAALVLALVASMYREIIAVKRRRDEGRLLADFTLLKWYWFTITILGMGLPAALRLPWKLPALPWTIYGGSAQYKPTFYSSSSRYLGSLTSGSPAYASGGGQQSSSGPYAAELPAALWQQNQQQHVPAVYCRVAGGGDEEAMGEGEDTGYHLCDNSDEGAGPTTETPAGGVPSPAMRSPLASSQLPVSSPVPLPSASVSLPPSGADRYGAAATAGGLATLNAPRSMCCSESATGASFGGVRSSLPSDGVSSPPSHRPDASEVFESARGLEGRETAVFSSASGGAVADAAGHRRATAPLAPQRVSTQHQAGAASAGTLASPLASVQPSPAVGVVVSPAAGGGGSAVLLGGRPLSERVLAVHSLLVYAAAFVGLVWFILSLRKGMLRSQFSQLGVMLVALVFIVAQALMQVANIYAGLIWFVLPTSLVIANDVSAYICGKLFGRTRLIRLSPNKTVEGFIGASLVTLLWASFAAEKLQQYPVFTCPPTAIDLRPFAMWKELRCQEDDVFKPRCFDADIATLLPSFDFFSTARHAAPRRQEEEVAAAAAEEEERATDAAEAAGAQQRKTAAAAGRGDKRGDGRGDAAGVAQLEGGGQGGRGRAATTTTERETAAATGGSSNSSRESQPSRYAATEKQRRGKDQGGEGSQAKCDSGSVGGEAAVDVQCAGNTLTSSSSLDTTRSGSEESDTTEGAGRAQSVAVGDETAAPSKGEEAASAAAEMLGRRRTERGQRGDAAEPVSGEATRSGGQPAAVWRRKGGSNDDLTWLIQEQQAVTDAFDIPKLGTRDAPLRPVLSHLSPAGGGADAEAGVGTVVSSSEEAHAGDSRFGCEEAAAEAPAAVDARETAAAAARGSAVVVSRTRAVSATAPAGEATRKCRFFMSPFQLHAVVLGVFAAFFAPFGGFLASGFKRAARVKDFGEVIPGHGGVTDRFDCQILSGMFTHLYYKSFVYEQQEPPGSTLNSQVAAAGAAGLPPGQLLRHSRSPRGAGSPYPPAKQHQQQQSGGAVAGVLQQQQQHGEDRPSRRRRCKKTAEAAATAGRRRRSGSTKHRAATADEGQHSASQRGKEVKEQQRRTSLNETHSAERRQSQRHEADSNEGAAAAGATGPAAVERLSEEEASRELKRRRQQEMQSQRATGAGQPPERTGEAYEVEDDETEADLQPWEEEDEDDEEDEEEQEEENERDTYIGDILEEIAGIDDVRELELVKEVVLEKLAHLQRRQQPRPQPQLQHPQEQQ